MPRKRNPRDVIVPCSGGRHKVRLARGGRFWAAASCPVCRAAVDPMRVLRVTRWITNLRWPASSSWTHRVTSWGTAGYLALALAAWVMIWGLSDRFWGATVLLFGPRWVLLLPFPLLLALVALRDRALILPLALAGVVVIGPVMGLQTGWKTISTPAEEGGDIKVVSFNAEGGEVLLRSPPDLLFDWGADVVAIQECGSRLAAELSRIPGWHFDVRNGLCLVSRLAIVDVAEMERESLEFAGGAGMVATYQLDLDGEAIFVTNLHLETPRAGFELIRAGKISEGVRKIREKSLLREIELRRAASWTAEFRGPHLVLGDFNTPVESRSYQESWAQWKNAFSVGGRGFGGTRLNGWIRVRIDHILANDAWRVLGGWLEEDVGSDHLPIAARLRLR